MAAAGLVTARIYELWLCADALNEGGRLPGRCHERSAVALCARDARPSPHRRRRANHFGAKLLLLDEPTAALSVRETRNVLESIRHARSQGLGVMYIDHNMSHVIPVADRIVLLEHGRIVRIIDRGEVSVEELQELVAKRHYQSG